MLLFWAVPTMHTPEATELLLKELHEGICESHTGADHCPTEPSLKAISGQTCKKKHRNM